MKMGDMGKWKLVGAGVVCCGIGLMGAYDAMRKTSWRTADAQVTALEVSCHMKATEHSVGYKTVYEKDIPCEAVDVFKSIHADKTWSTTEQFDATLKVTGADGSTTTAQMDLHRKDGVAPAVGDAFPVVQDPANPSKVAQMDSAGMSALVGILFGAVGALIMWFAFGGFGKARRARTTDTVAEGEASEKRAEAMIAAAMAQMNKQQAKPAQAAPAKPSFQKAAQKAAPRVPLVQGGARTSFGLKR